MSDTAQTKRFRTHEQETRYSSPWSKWTHARLIIWRMTWLLLFRPTPKLFTPWRLFLLKLFGAKIAGHPHVAASVKVAIPWHLTLEDHACLAPGAEVYNLGHVTLQARCTVAQQVYLCAGTHDFSDPKLPLIVGTIEIGENAFLGVRAVVMPGVHIGAGCVIGGGAIVTKDTPPWTICAGNPARVIRMREMKQASSEDCSGEDGGISQ